ncbi:hypothetical protein SAMN04487905_106157 [Actinopolyspora xinjiangensis]|uniref:Uncharacterized protein n=1 Tax=Actinopolyspora xinjiangensis TaxID=405564 RepID=A0A1H0UAS0_9ACTN|nr:hypothetical protein [Actinopolyspora xinjiangensis]SDP63098.1 hypothetical protein SAMN04487905_106157 [Actinopolyspora xinjiangensis]
MGELVALWDGAESWLVLLPYPFQVALVLVVLVPLCWLVARLVDRIVDEISAKASRVRDAEPPLRSRERYERRTGDGSSGHHHVVSGQQGAP